MHIELNEENKDKLLKVSGELNLSVSSIVNGVIASVDCIKIEHEIRFGLKGLKSKKPMQPLKFGNRSRTIF